MKNFNRYYYWLTGIWFLINLSQAFVTGLHSDESYYWMYSQNLDWGYFDHPPMVALLIYFGSSLLPGEIGVRLFFVILSTLSFALIINEIKDNKNQWFLTLFVLSFPLVHTHISGFLAIPDIPLLFFSLLFLLVYKQFSENQNWRNAIILGILVPAMIYSKYHAFLIIGFTLLSDIKLLKSKYFYGIVLISLIILIPHILWQINNQFPTFKYHLVERSKPFQFKYVFPYILGTIAVAGPVTVLVVVRNLKNFRIKSKFQKALLFNIAGFLLLFLFMSFKNRIEIHWLSAIIPMIIFMVFPVVKNDLKIKKWFQWYATPVIVLLLIFRVYIAFDIFPNIGSLKITFYNREKSAQEIKKLANGKSVAFYNNYAAISNYIFYTGEPAVLLSTPKFRFCQFDLWDDESAMRGKTLFAVQPKNLNPPNMMELVTGEKKGFIEIESFQPLNGLNIKIDSIIDALDKYNFSCSLYNANSYPVFTGHISEPALGIMVDKNEIASFPLSNSSESEKIEGLTSATICFSIPKQDFQKTTHFQIYTRTKENYRGEIKSIAFADFTK